MFGFRGSDQKLLIVTMILVALLSMSFLPLIGANGHELEMDNVPISPPISGDWSVTGTETYKDSIIDVHGNLTVSGSLILDNITLRMNISGMASNTIYVLNDATFVLRNGSELMGLNGSIFFFEAHDGSYVEINGSTINGCGLPMRPLRESGPYIETDNFYMNCSTIQFCNIGLIGDGANMSIRDSSISNCNDEGIHLIEDSYLLSNRVNITNIPGNAIYAEDSNVMADMNFFQESGLSLLSKRSNIEMRNSGLHGMYMFAMESISSNIELMDCYPMQIGNDLLLVTSGSGPSIIHLLNTTLSGVEVEGSSVVTEAYRFDIGVTTNNGFPAKLADVEISGSDGKVERQALTDDNGWITDLPLIAFHYNSTGKYSNDPHQLAVLYEGAVRSKSFNVLERTFETIEVLISEPMIKIGSPLNNTWFDTRSIVITGTITDPRPLVSFSMFLDGGNEILMTPSKNFEIHLDFGSDREHDLRLRTMNDDGKFSEAFTHFGIDTVDPSLTVTSPIEGIYTNLTPIKVEGSCDVDARLYIDENLAPHSDGTFSFDIYLKEGRNSIVIEAVDQAGNTVRIIRTIDLDTTPPTVMILSPANGTRTKNDWIIVEGAISHDTVMVILNGVEIDFDLRGFSYRLEDMKEGINRISVEVLDKTGSVGSSSVNIFVDTLAPSIEMIRPPMYTNNKDMAISGWTEADADMMVNGIPVDVEQDGLFSTVVELYMGRNNISISSRDRAGNVNDIFFDVIYDTEKPTFDRILPLDRSTFRTVVILIQGEVYDNSGIKAVRGSNSTGASRLLSRNMTFEWVVTLEPGENIFTIEAEDVAGNIREMDIHYTYDTSSMVDNEPPTLTILSPANNSRHENGNITITGTALDDSGWLQVRVRVKGGDWIVAEGTTSWHLILTLDIGMYIIQVIAEDISGNWELEEIQITVVLVQDDPGEKEKNDLDVPMTIFIMILIVIAIIIVVFLLIRNQRLREEWIQQKQVIESEREFGRGRSRSPGSRRPGAGESRERVPRERRRSHMDRNASSRMAEIEDDGPGGRRRPVGRRP